MRCGIGRRRSSDPTRSGVGWRLQLRFNPWPGNLHMPWEQPQKRQKDKKTKKKTLKTLKPGYLDLNRGPVTS